MVKTHIIRIGNALGIRIPKPLLEQSGISGEVELETEEGRIIIHAVAHPRRSWEEASPRWPSTETTPPSTPTSPARSGTSGSGNHAAPAKPRDGRPPDL